MTDDDALDARIDEIAWKLHPEIRRRNNAEYDGIMGKLDDWIPENFHHEFSAIRNKLLSTYRHSDLLAYIAEMRSEWGMQGNRDAGELAELIELHGALRERELGLSRGGMFSGAFRPRTPAPIWRDVCRLAQFQEAVAEGPVKGLALLTDNEHAGKVIHGKKFTGRKPGSFGPIRKWTVRQLAKNPTLKNRELWALFKAKPVRGWMAMENREGKYLEGPSSGDNMSYGRFSNIAKEERDKLKG